MATKSFTEQDYMGSKGFTLIELIITILIVTIGITPIFLMVQYPLTQIPISTSRLIGAYLAQEGIEVVRNIRDTNWLQSLPWDTGLAPGDYEADYGSASLTPYTPPGRVLLLDQDHFYNYEEGNPTKFTRKITITSGPPGILTVTAFVTWSQKGKNYSISAQENLYNWWGPRTP